MVGIKLSAGSSHFQIAGQMSDYISTWNGLQWDQILLEFSSSSGLHPGKLPLSRHFSKHGLQVLPLQ
jgi:hypothetical protein